jgi:hypothetical protein
MPTPPLPVILSILFLCLLLPEAWRGLRFLQMISPGAHRQRAQAAGTKGWCYTPGRFPHPLLYTLHGQTQAGIPWRLEVFRQRATWRGAVERGFAYSCWQVETPSAAAGDQLLIAPRLPAVGGFLDSFYGRHFVLRGMLPAALMTLADLPKVTAGSESLHHRYTIHSSRAGGSNPFVVAHHLLTAAAEALLLAWPLQSKKPWYAPIILWHEGGLQIRLLAAVFDLSTLEYLVNLGQALVSTDKTR